MLAGAFLALVGVSTAWADDAPPPAPVRIHELTRQIDVRPDGSSLTTTHTEIQILSDALLSQMAQQTLNYDPAFQKLAVTEAYTLKADGERIAVLPDAIMDRQSQQSGAALTITDKRERVIVFPQVEVGDTVVFTTTTESAPLIPGYFGFDTVLPTALLIDDARVTVTAPPSLPLSVSTVGLRYKKTSRAGNTIYVTSYSNRSPVSNFNDPMASFDRGPKFSVSSFKTYDELAQVYSRILLPKIAVSSSIKSQADAVTAGAIDPREQARRIYDWVTLHIRYVAIELGTGGFIPHDPASVLEKGYGDCKDHAALFSALLKAKGIESEFVLINGSNAYTVSEAPTFSAFNHMITWLPQFSLYADTTSGVTSFGSLPPTEYGKPVLHVVGSGSALRHTPVPTADDATIHYTTVATIDDDAQLTINTTSTATGRFAAALRVYAMLIRSTGGPKFAGNMLKLLGMPLAKGDIAPVSPADLSDSYSISAHYQTSSNDAANVPFTLPVSFGLISPTGDLFLGPLANSKFDKASDAPCYSGRLVEDYSLQLPANKHVEKVPEDLDSHAGHFAYLAHWSVTGNMLNVHREFSASFDEAICPAAIHGEVNDALAKIRDAQNTRIALVANP
jgi:transglutaminase-like putative cysteine protease